MTGRKYARWRGFTVLALGAAGALGVFAVTQLSQPADRDLGPVIVGPLLLFHPYRRRPSPRLTLPPHLLPSPSSALLLPLCPIALRHPGASAHPRR
ncbi:MAG: hypothetical protein R2722_17720 [Tessaracoccus sp.]